MQKNKLYSLILTALICSLVILSLMQSAKAIDYFTDGFEVNTSQWERFQGSISTEFAHHGVNSTAMNNGENCVRVESTAENLLNELSHSFLGASLYWNNFTANANWIQDYLQIRNGTVNLMGFTFVRSQDSGVTWKLGVALFDMGEMTWTENVSDIEAPQDVWNWIVLEFEQGNGWEYVATWLNGVVIAELNITIAQNFKSDNILIGGQKCGGFSSETFFDCIVYSDTYPTDPFITDETPPTLTLLSPENVTYSNATIDLTFNSNETLDWQRYSLNGLANVSITGNVTLAPFTNGTYTIQVFGADVAGNENATELVTFTVELSDIGVVEPATTTDWMTFALLILLFAFATFFTYRNAGLLSFILGLLAVGIGVYTASTGLMFGGYLQAGVAIMGVLAMIRGAAGERL